MTDVDRISRQAGDGFIEGDDAILQIFLRPIGAWRVYSMTIDPAYVHRTPLSSLR